MGLSGRLAQGGTQLAFWWQTLASRDKALRNCPFPYTHSGEWITVLSSGSAQWSLYGKEGIQGVDDQNYRMVPSFTVNLPYHEKSLKTDENPTGPPGLPSPHQTCRQVGYDSKSCQPSYLSPMAHSSTPW